jgi:hypothetical protein
VPGFALWKFPKEIVKREPRKAGSHFGKNLIAQAEPDRPGPPPYMKGPTGAGFAKMVRNILMANNLEVNGLKTRSYTVFGCA